jgi:tetrapyrrole methylase family protein/MazG family protein
MDKAEEEWAEFKAEVHAVPTAPDKMALEFGDLLFTLVNVARLARFHPDSALTSAILKFEQRFRMMEKEAADSGRQIDEVGREEKEQLWEKAKGREF